MKKKFSTKWKASKQPRKQRKYRHQATLHVLGRFLRAPLSKELAKKNGVKRARIVVGDKVKVMVGKFRGKEGKIEMIRLKKSKAVITGIEVSKKDGSKSRPLFHASNLMIIDLNLENKKRFKSRQEKQRK